MKAIVTILMLSSVLTLSAHADQTISEQFKASGRAVKRGTKKAMNRAAEALCGEGDLKCAAKKVKNRAVEAKDAVVDTAVELKEKVD